MEVEVILRAVATRVRIQKRTRCGRGQGKGHGGGQGGGAAGGHGRGRRCVRGPPPPASSWDDVDNRNPALHLPQDVRLTFSVFFTEVLLDAIVEFTNTYAALHILEYKSYALPDGSWQLTI